jgi:hypothetical protein
VVALKNGFHGKLKCIEANKNKKGKVLFSPKLTTANCKQFLFGRAVF